jgi:chloride channel protein, CIC family
VFYVTCQVVFHVALDGLIDYRPAEPAGESALFSETLSSFRPWLLLIVPTIGGLLSGWLVFTFAPEAEGHSTDAAIASYHYHQGYIRPWVPLIKIISSALTISTGRSGGREGPIAQIGAGFGSFLGSVLKLRPVERRILMGAGVAAIFRAPLAGALFAAMVLYFSPDFESEVIMPSALASVAAYCTFGLAFGSRNCRFRRNGYPLSRSRIRGSSGHTRSWLFVSLRSDGLHAQFLWPDSSWAHPVG